MNGVIESTRNDVRAAADQCLQRFCAAGEIGNLNVETFIFEIAQALGERKGQIKQRGFTADGDRDVGFFQCLGMGERAEKKQTEVNRSTEKCAHAV